MMQCFQMVSSCSYPMKIPSIPLHDLLSIQSFPPLLSLELEGFGNGNDWIFYDKVHMGSFQCEQNLEQEDTTTFILFLHES